MRGAQDDPEGADQPLPGGVFSGVGRADILELLPVRHRAAGAGCAPQARILIGRGEDCDVQLTSDRVSRHHCEVVYKDGHYELNDLAPPTVLT